LRLSELQGRQRSTRERLAEARVADHVAERNLARVAVAVYESDQTPWLGVVLGASSLDDLLTRLDDEQRVSQAQVAVVKQVRAARDQLERQTRELARELASERRAAAELAARRTAIEAKLQERGRLLSSIKNEIVVLRAKERARQRELARQARIHLAQEIAAARRSKAAAARQARLVQAARARAAALQEERAAALAEKRARVRAPVAPVQPPTSTTPPTTAPSTAPSPQPPPATTTPATTPAPSPPSPPSPPSAGATGGNTQVVAIALRYLGVPYRWGSASPQTGFDCSGLVMYVFAQIGISLPHYAAAQYRYGTAVARDQLEPGDLVFFDNLNHVGIYIGSDQFVHAPHTGDVVKISNLSDAWYTDHYVGARRIT
jgi:cell wall-associated NlpC family hydrolase